MNWFKLAWVLYAHKDRFVGIINEITIIKSEIYALKERLSELYAQILEEYEEIRSEL